MAIGNFNSEQPRGLGNLFLENALAGLGQQAGRGAGYLAGAGLGKLGRLAGIGGPSNELVQLLMSQGMSEQEAKAFSDLDPKAQQQLLQNLGSLKQQQQREQSFKALPTAMQEQELTQQGAEIQPDIAEQLTEEETKKEAPVFIPSYSEMYSDFLRQGVDEKTAKNVLKDYDKQYTELTKESKEFSKEIDDKAKAAKESTPRLKKMYNLVEKGDLAPAQVASLLKTVENGIHLLGIGFDMNALMNGDSQEFAKLSSDFSKLISNYFPGGRITNVMIDQFMKTIPTMVQSDEGKLRVISNLMNLNEAAEVYAKAKKQILKETKGKIPLNLQELIQERVGPQLAEIEENYLSGNVKSLPGFKETEKKAQRKGTFETYGALAGGSLGGAGLGALGARIGGRVGAALGPVGALTGYGLGALGGSLLSGLSGLGGGEELSPEIAQRLNALSTFRKGR
jgi:hypothetical protein